MIPVQAPSVTSWIDKVEKLAALKQGWDGYSAPQPGTLAIDTAKSFLQVMSEQDLLPTRVSASAVGGVGITVSRLERKVYIEFYNDGVVCALFGIGDPQAVVKQVTANKTSFERIIGELQEYLDARPAS